MEPLESITTPLSAHPPDEHTGSLGDLPDWAVVGDRDRQRITGNLGRTRWWQIRRDDPTAPKPVQLSPGRIGWRVGDLRRWLAERPMADRRMAPERAEKARAGRDAARMRRQSAA